MFSKLTDILANSADARVAATFASGAYLLINHFARISPPPTWLNPAVWLAFLFFLCLTIIDFADAWLSNRRR